MIRPAPGLPIEQQPEAWVECACVWAEARGEPTKGKLAVRCVIHTRAMTAGTSDKEQVLKPRQFSSFNADDPNRVKLLGAHLADPDGWAACEAVCDLFEAGLTLDPTMGATHYLNRDALLHQPSWSLAENGWEPHVIIGHHEFGRAA